MTMGLRKVARQTGSSLLLVISAIYLMAGLSPAKVPPPGPGKCYGSCVNPTGPKPSPTYTPNKPSPQSYRQREARRLNRIGVGYTKRGTVPAYLKALAHFRRACRLSRYRAYCNNARFADAWLYNAYGMHWHRVRRYRKAAANFRKAVARCPRVPYFIKSCRVMDTSLRDAVRLANAGGGASHDSAASRRLCSTCGRALHNDIFYGISKTGNVFQYVSQSRAKFQNCIRRTRKRCCGTNGTFLNARIKANCKPPHLQGGSSPYHVKDRNYRRCLKHQLHLFQTTRPSIAWKIEHC
jgi:hypothetical protein